MAPAGTDVTPSPAPGRSKPVAAVLLLAVGVVGAVVGAVTFLWPAEDDWRSSADAQDVVTVATDFAVAYNTYDATELDDYQQRVGPLLTDDYRAEFEKVTDATFGTLAEQQQISRDAAVLSVGIDDLDDDSARVLVAVESSLTNSGAADAIARHGRWIVELSRSGEDWSVSGFQPFVLSDAVARTDEPTPTPEVTP